jgi:hypothetical protein
MEVRVDGARHDDSSTGLDDLDRRTGTVICPDARDGTVSHADIGLLCNPVRYDGPSANE